MTTGLMNLIFLVGCVESLRVARNTVDAQMQLLNCIRSLMPSGSTIGLLVWYRVLGQPELLLHHLTSSDVKIIKDFLVLRCDLCSTNLSLRSF